MRRLSALMLSDGSKVAFGPPISVRTQQGIDDDATDAAGRKIDR